MDEIEFKRLSELIGVFCETRDSDLWILSGPITSKMYQEMLHGIGAGVEQRRQNMYLFAATYGGDANTAYRIARLLQKLYSKISIAVHGPCKSAGTLISVAADEVVFGPFGELGPLDIQIQKPDEFFFVSGLDTIEGFECVSRRLFDTYDTYMRELLTRAGPSLSLKTMNEIATNLAAAYVGPIASQIDPYRLGEVERLMLIARKYGESLNRGNLRPSGIEKLVTGYPSHDFIIDDKEADTMFKNVRLAEQEEIEISNLAAELVLTPSSTPQIINLGALAVPKGESNGEPGNGGNKTGGTAKRGAKPDTSLPAQEKRRRAKAPSRRSERPPDEEA